MTSPTLVIVGASSLCGEALLGLVSPASPALCLARCLPHEPDGALAHTWCFCDLEDLSPASLADQAAALPVGPQVWISFAPIWLLAPHLEALWRERPESLAGLRGVVACSSSSVITKRFAANRHDRDLVARLNAAQQNLLATCRARGAGCVILAPTLIHGRTAHHRDRNVETLRRLLRCLPLVVLPARTGMRQPLAAASLAAVALAKARGLAADAAGSIASPGDVLLPLGGDETLSYRDLLLRIQAVDPVAARCRLLTLPTGVFQLLAAPLLLLSPRWFEALQRLSVDLAGFVPAAELLGLPAQPFSVAKAE